MPKEVIQYPSTQTRAGTELAVHWSRDNHVQVEARRHVFGYKHLPDCSCLTGDHPCESMPAVVSSDAPETDPYVDEPAQVFTEVLSRSDINKLIRVLRRARDAAYGADA
jgi:hypothetical protein